MNDKIDLDAIEREASKDLMRIQSATFALLAGPDKVAQLHRNAVEKMNLVRAVRAAMVVHSAGSDAMPDDWIEMAEALAVFTDSAEVRDDE